MAAPRTARARAPGDVTRLHIRLSTLAWPHLTEALLAEGAEGMTQRARQLLALGLLAEQAGLSVAGPASAPVLVRLGEEAAAAAIPIGRGDWISPAPPRSTVGPTHPPSTPPRRAPESAKPGPTPAPPGPGSAPAPAATSASPADEAPMQISEAGMALMESLGLGV